MRDSNDKAKKIKKIAFKLFLEKGYEATTVRMLCKKAKIEAPTLYYYFKSKKGLFFAVIDDILEDYKVLLEEFSIESCTNPEEKLIKFFKFSVNYSIIRENETRFYLRYRLFKPNELKKDIDIHMKETYENKRKLYIEPLQECISLGEIEYDLNEAFQKLTNFIDNCTFNIIFSQWRPSEKEIDISWKLFYEYQMKKL